MSLPLSVAAKHSCACSLKCCRAPLVRVRVRVKGERCVVSGEW